MADTGTQSESASLPSPCVGVCLLNPEQLCLGCGRSIEEIAQWGQLSTEQQRVVSLKAAARYAALQEKDWLG